MGAAARAAAAGDLPPAALYLLCQLAELTGKDGRAIAAVASIASDLGMSKRTAQRCIKRLESDGWIDVERVSGRSKANSYYPRMPHCVNGERVTPKAVTLSGDFEIVKGDIKGVIKGDTQGVTLLGDPRGSDLTTNAPASSDRSEERDAANAIQKKFPPECVDAQLAGGLISISEAKRREH